MNITIQKLKIEELLKLLIANIEVVRKEQCNYCLKFNIQDIEILLLKVKKLNIKMYFLYLIHKVIMYRINNWSSSFTSEQ